MRIYTAPGVGAYTTDSDSLNVDLSLAAGTYNTVVQAWDNCGGVGKTPVTITVSGNTLPPPKFVYSSDNAGNKVYEYLVDASTGELTATTEGSIATPAGPARIASDRGGFRLYVSSSTKSGQALAAYFINRDNGSLQAVPGSPAIFSGYPTAVVVHPSGDFVYVTTTSGSNNQTNYIYAFKVKSNGSLTAVSGSPFASKYWPTQVVIDTTGSHLYIPVYSPAYVEAYDINKSTGALTLMAGQPFALPKDQTGCASGAYDVAFAQSGQHLVVPEINCNGAVAVFNVGSNGALTNAPGSPVLDPVPDQQEPFGLQAVAVDPLNRWWYLYEEFPGELPSSDLATLTAQDTAERTGTNCGDIVRADPSGKFVYAIGNTTGNGVCGVGPGAILGFSVNQSNGTLTPLSGSPFASPNADYQYEDGLVVTQ
ncbi:MAG: beta-propeller fold lactonase family protein [Terriglobales bacterium]|jgi:6-phosphogluconolactonase (cycloisomerase 2 family)